MRITKTQMIKDVLREMYSNNNNRNVFDRGHGFSWSNSKSHWTERCWWVIGFGLSLICCGLSVQKIWITWHERPVVIGLVDKAVPISAIPFPTITICPETKTSKDNLDLVSIYHALETQQELSNFTNIELNRMEALIHLCHFEHHKAFVGEHFGNRFVNDSIYQLIQEMAPTCNETLSYCKWQETKYPCMELFKPVFTEKGICFAFNALNSRDTFSKDMVPELQIVTDRPNVLHWNRESGYINGMKTSPYPIRVFNSNQDLGLNVYMRLLEKDMEFLCGSKIHGFRVILSTPGETLQMSKSSFRIPTLEEATVSIMPKMIKTSKELRGYDSHQRQCFYAKERRLKFFNFYAERNCQIECLANYTLRECGCVKFSMPREKHTNICGTKNVRCYQDAEKRLYGEDIIEGLSDDDAKAFRIQCNCLSTCLSISYEVNIDRAKLRWKEWSKSFNISAYEYAKYKYSQLIISFGRHQVETLKRYERYSYTEFLSVCGGLLGLFLGLSALSIIKFTHNFAVRFVYVLKQSKSKQHVQLFHHKASNNCNSIRNNLCNQSNVNGRYY